MKEFSQKNSFAINKRFVHPRDFIKGFKTIAYTYIWQSNLILLYRSHAIILHTFLSAVCQQKWVFIYYMCTYFKNNRFQNKLMQAGASCCFFGSGAGEVRGDVTFLTNPTTKPRRKGNFLLTIF